MQWGRDGKGNYYHSDKSVNNAVIKCLVNDFCVNRKPKIIKVTFIYLPSLLPMLVHLQSKPLLFQKEKAIKDKNKRKN